MTCSYCGTRNGQGDHRCRRCGRKPDDTLTSEFSFVRTDGALAAQPQLAEQSSAPPPPRIVAHAGGKPHTAQPGPVAVQTSLFHDRGNPKIVAFADYAPPAPRQKTAAKATAKSAARRPRPVVEEQAQLPFLPPQPAKPRTLSTTVDSVIYCEAPVATSLHRLVAAALDWAVVLIAYGLLLTVFYALGGQFTLNKTTAMAFAGMLLITGFAYGMVWTVAGSETAGMHWMKLRLTTFDGFPPEPRQRVLRLFGSCLSACTVLGLLWSLADEESLTWQDHISRTFPTPVALDQQIFRRV
jgi:uncharacterized RDD family membrane protein YckC